MDREFLGRHRSVNSVSVGLGLSLPVHRSQSTTLLKSTGLMGSTDVLSGSRGRAAVEASPP